MNVNRFKGWRSRRLLMPDKETIVCFFYLDHGSDVSTYDGDHNVFRLNAQGKVLWQVQRDDKGRWQGMLERFERGERDSAPNEPFQYIDLLYPDGSTNINSKTGSPPDEAIWTNGCVVRLSSWNGWFFILDVDTGIATDITPRPHRPW